MSTLKNSNFELGFFQIRVRFSTIELPCSNTIAYCPLGSIINLNSTCFLSENGDDAIKSEISLVHEIALKRNMNVDFKVGETIL